MLEIYGKPGIKHVPIQLELQSIGDHFYKGHQIVSDRVQHYVRKYTFLGIGKN